MSVMMCETFVLIACVGYDGNCDDTCSVHMCSDSDEVMLKLHCYDASVKFYLDAVLQPMEDSAEVPLLSPP